MRIRSFPIAALQRNLALPLNPILDTPALKHISLTFGFTECPARPALQILYITQLPRLYAKHQTKISVDESKEDSKLRVAVGDEEMTVPLDYCKTDSDVIKSIGKVLNTLTSTE